MSNEEAGARTAPMQPGEKRGRLTLVRRCAPPKFSRRAGSKESWGVFRCDCGKQKALRVTAVVNGHSRSCGCAPMETIRRLNNAHVLECEAARRQRARALRGGPR